MLNDGKTSGSDPREFTVFAEPVTDLISGLKNPSEFEMNCIDMICNSSNGLKNAIPNSQKS